MGTYFCSLEAFYNPPHFDYRSAVVMHNRVMVTAQIHSGEQISR